MPIKISELLANSPHPDEILTSSDGFPMYNASADETVGIDPYEIIARAGGFDHVIRDVQQLHDVFGGAGSGTPLSAGDTVKLHSKAVPFNNTEWLDIDVSGVTVVGSGIGTYDISVANGGEVGGFRLGPNNAIEDVTLFNISYYGNAANQTANALDFVKVRDCDWAKILRCRIENTAPQDEHHTGGSGVTVEQPSVRCVVRGCEFYDIGDRGIQSGSLRGDRFINNYFDQTYDRPIAFNYRDPRTGDGTDNVEGSYAIAANNHAKQITSGSFIGSSDGPAVGHIVVGNSWNGEGKGGVTSFPEDATGPSEWVVVSNIFRRTAQPSLAGTNTRGIGIIAFRGSVIKGNIVHDVTNTDDRMDYGIHAVGNCVIEGNYVTIDNPASTNGNALRCIEPANVTGNFFSCPNDIIVINGDVDLTRIDGNILSGTDNRGIFIESGSGLNVITDNSLVNSGSATAFVESNGRSSNSGIVVFSDNYNGPGASYAFNNGDPEVYAGNRPPYFANVITASFTGGQTQTFTLDTSVGGSRQDVVHVKPANDPGNDVGFSVDSVYWDDSTGDLKVRISETENAGGGDALIIHENAVIDQGAL